MLDRSETTASYQQTWERGGKREARVGVAAAEVELTRLRQTVRRLDLIELQDLASLYGMDLVELVQEYLARTGELPSVRKKAR